MQNGFSNPKSCTDLIQMHWEGINISIYDYIGHSFSALWTCNYAHRMEIYLQSTQYTQGQWLTGLNRI